MPSKKTISLIKSLSRASIRHKEKLFIVEGYKSIIDLIPHFYCEKLIIDNDNLNKVTQAIDIANIDTVSQTSIEIVDESFNFCKISNLKTPPRALAIFRFKELCDTYNKISGISLFLDDIQDPGNMGTIIRTADWFDIKTIYITKGCVDIYSPKVVQATMGSLARVKIIEVFDIKSFFNNINCPILGTFLDGESIYDIKSIEYPILIVMGNEGNGISSNVERFINNRINIPIIGNRENNDQPDSLNVAIATAIVVSHFSNIT